jgi:thymidine kinase
MATAEYVTKVHAVCTHTGNLAQFSHRTSSDDGIVVLGEKETYEPLSRAAFYKANQKKQVQGKEKAQKQKKKL